MPVRLLLALAVIGITPAFAERPATQAEGARLAAAVTAQGCSGGKMEWDESDRHFEVDDVVCADGLKYDLKFGPDYQFLSKKRDD